MPLLSYLTKDVDVIDGTSSLIEILLSLTLNTAGGCGRNYEARMSSFSGTWSGLSFDRKENVFEGEILVSNKISTSCRLQPSCVCSEILYAVAGILDSTYNNTDEEIKFAFKPSDIKVFGAGSEFLYIKYPIFKIGGVLDLTILSDKKTSSFPLKNEPDGLSVNERDGDDDDDENKDDNSFDKSHSNGDKTALSSSVTPREPLSKRKKKIEENDVEDDNNVVDMSQLMAMMMSGSGGQGSSNSRSSTLCASGGNGKRKRTNQQNNNINVYRNNNKGGNFIIPTPQIIEESIDSYIQSFLNTGIVTIRVKSNIKCNGEEGEETNNAGTFNLGVKYLKETTNKHIILPPNNTIFSPPLIIRTHYNIYRILTGLLMFFDHIEEKNEEMSVVLNDHAAHRGTFKLLSKVRDYSIRNSVHPSNKNNDEDYDDDKDVIVRMDVPPNPAGGGVYLSKTEVDQREISSATLLNILSNLIK